MEASRKVVFDKLRHKNSACVDDLKTKLRKLYLQDLKARRGRHADSKRDIDLFEERELEFYRQFCQKYFQQTGDSWETDEEFLTSIWAEIRDEEGLVDGYEEDLEASTDGDLQIVCPLCLKLPAVVEECRLRCACGLDLRLPAFLTAKDVEQVITTSCELHDTHCRAPLSFTIHRSPNSDQLVSSCEHCQTLNVILESPKETSLME